MPPIPSHYGLRGTTISALSRAYSNARTFNDLHHMRVVYIDCMHARPGYDAWTRSPGGDNQFEYHPNNFCDCGGDGSCDTWVYASPHMLTD